MAWRLTVLAETWRGSPLHYLIVHCASQALYMCRLPSPVLSELDLMLTKCPVVRKDGTPWAPSHPQYIPGVYCI